MTRKRALFTPLMVVAAISTGCSGERTYEDSWEDQTAEDDASLLSESHDEPIDGTYLVEACSANSGNCYELEADIYNGWVETIYFPNGGHLDIDGAELDQDGYAAGGSYTWEEGYNEDMWEITVPDWGEQ